MNVNNQLNLYQESGNFSPINLILANLGTLLLIIPISYFYSLFIAYFPLIYFNIIAVVLYGYLIALINDAFHKAFKIRNKKITTIYSIATAIFAYYAQWVSYFYVISIENVTLFFEPGLFFSIFLKPLLIIENIFMLNKLGSWEMFSVTFKGGILSLIWILEFLIILLSCYFGLSKIKIRPFSENDNNWYKKETFDFHFEPIRLRKDFMKDYLNNPFDAINNLEKGNLFRYSKIYIYHSNSETKSLIGIDNVTETERGKGKKEYEEIIAPNYIDNIYTVQLKQKFKIKKRGFFDFFYELYS